MNRSMQPGTASNAADAYLTWQDLLAEEAETDVTPAPVETHSDQPTADVWSASGQITLPPDVEALLAEKDRLESDLKRLSGFGDAPPEDERIKRMYPVKVHTKDSRIEERRLRRHDDHQRLLKQRALEAKLSQAREERRQAELAAERRRRAIERALARVRAEVRQAEAEAEQRRKAIERAQAALREQARQAEYAAEQRGGAGTQSVGNGRSAKALGTRSAEGAAETGPGTPPRVALAGAGAGRTAGSGTSACACEESRRTSRPRQKTERWAVRPQPTADK
jgi:hypothetical protein